MSSAYAVIFASVGQCVMFLFSACVGGSGPSNQVCVGRRGCKNCNGGFYMDSPQISQYTKLYYTYGVMLRSYEDMAPVICSHALHVLGFQ